MLTLALDTSGVACSVCIYDARAEKIIGNCEREIGRGHAELLIDLVNETVSASGVTYETLSRIVTSVGPGSFTGARVCVAAARGFALSLNKPVVGVSNFDAYIAYAQRKHSSGKVISIVPAGRGQVFCQFSFDSEFEKANKPFVCDIEKVSSFSSQAILCGPSMRETSQLFKTPLVQCDTGDFSLINEIARVGSGMQISDTRPEPLYLRKPDAKPQQKFAVERAN